MVGEVPEKRGASVSVNILYSRHSGPVRQCIGGVEQTLMHKSLLCKEGAAGNPAVAKCMGGEMGNSAEGSLWWIEASVK